MKQFFMLLVGVFLLVAQLASAHMGSNLVRVYYLGGAFAWNGGLDWVEQDANGVKFSFLEIARDSDSVMLFDESRNVFVSLDTVNWW